ncbi:SCO5918 family protein [Streptomyces sp. TRM 70351]|uniref:SCO5918 family protein n=1 Tax=Streptomyces sp. TRM 70351 TaxID=3116552 RepID=UPI002E7B1549|nr:SCO5918 family protein [Streptomyces sp. TRM 70351]MEE1929518.1 SCO5918 family protein [Streptomyces sp. TRM 70351]
MRCVIAHYPFDFIKSEVQAAMRGIAPEPVPAGGETVTVGRRTYPVKQVGEVITRQDRRDFSAQEVTRALTRLGFTCHAPAPVPAAPGTGLTALQNASAMLGTAPAPAGPERFPA